MKNCSLLFRSVLLIIIFLSAVSARAEEWRGWRGLDKQAVGDSIPVPTEWSATKNVLWKTQIPGEGYSSPVVNEKYVFITAAEISRDRMNLYQVLFSAVILIIILIILKDVIKIVKAGKSEERSKARQISDLLLISVYGLLLFSFIIMIWMFRGERTLHKVFINYLFSGAVVILCILLTIYKTRKNSIYIGLTAVLIAVLTLMLIRFRPSPNYFALKEFFSKANIWLFPVSASALFLPLLISLYLIIVFILEKLNPRTTGRQIDTGKEGRTIYRRLLPFSFIISALGFLSVPVISFLKLYVVNADAIRIKPTITPSLFFDPDFAFPFFLGFLCIGFLIWFLLFRSRDEENVQKRFSSFQALTILSCLVFIVLNYSNSGPEYLRQVYCVDRNTGRVVWKKDFLRGPALKISNYNSQASPTALLDEQGVYAYFGSAGMISADYSGNLRWENKNLAHESNHGVGNSPIFCEQGIVILSSMSEHSYITTLKKETGETHWKTDLPPAMGGEYRTPVIYHSGDKDYIVDWSGILSILRLYSAETGELEYTYTTNWQTLGESVSTPILQNDTLILADAGSYVAVSLKKIMNNESPVIWSTDLNHNGTETVSPVFINNMIFLVSDHGVASCLDMRTGKILWQKRLRGSFLSSPIISGNKVYFTNNAGVTTILECSPEYRLVSENNLGEGVYSSLTPADGQLFIRTKNALWCIKK